MFVILEQLDTELKLLFKIIFLNESDDFDGFIGFSFPLMYSKLMPISNSGKIISSKLIQLSKFHAEPPVDSHS